MVVKQHDFLVLASNREFKYTLFVDLVCKVPSNPSIAKNNKILPKYEVELHCMTTPMSCITQTRVSRST